MEQKIDREDVANPEEIPILQHLECTIDNMISTNPVVCIKCETIFCQSCLDDWKKRSNTCPMRCSPLEIYNPLEKDTTIKKQLAKIKVYCKYKNYGCKEGVLLAEQNFHEKNCLYQPTKCSECGQNIPKINIPRHILESCSNCQLKCVICERQQYPNNYIEHIEECITKKISCTCGDYHDNSSHNCLYKIKNCTICNLPDLGINYEKSLHQCLLGEEKKNKNQLAMYILYLRKKLVSYYEEFSNRKNSDFETIFNKYNKIVEMANIKNLEIQNCIPGKQKIFKDDDVRKISEFHKENIVKIENLEKEIECLTKENLSKHF